MKIINGSSFRANETPTDSPSRGIYGIETARRQSFFLHNKSTKFEKIVGGAADGILELKRDL